MSFLDSFKKVIGSDDRRPSSSNGFFLSALCVLFIGLKLTGHIAWSWWWVLAPLWLPVVILIGLIVPIMILLSKD